MLKRRPVRPGLDLGSQSNRRDISARTRGLPAAADHQAVLRGPASQANGMTPARVRRLPKISSPVRTLVRSDMPIPTHPSIDFQIDPGPILTAIKMLPRSGTDISRLKPHGSFAVCSKRIVPKDGRAGPICGRRVHSKWRWRRYAGRGRRV